MPRLRFLRRPGFFCFGFGLTISLDGGLEDVDWSNVGIQQPSSPRSPNERIACLRRMVRRLDWRHERADRRRERVYHRVDWLLIPEPWCPYHRFVSVGGRAHRLRVECRMLGRPPQRLPSVANLVIPCDEQDQAARLAIAPHRVGS